MRDVLILEFEGVAREDYEAVNAILGIDPVSGGGDWPAGMVNHVGGGKAGGWVVIEVWESRQAQQEFMDRRLGAALGEVGLPAPTRVEWLDVAGLASPGA